MEENTICAISTPNGVGGISIIRMSGKDSLKFASSVFKCKDIDVYDFEPNKLYLGTFSFEDIREKCFCVYFKAPRSYTGEDLIEFQCHGGIAITNMILKSLVKVGCSLAGAGEFTKRAFINGKLSLDEAEGVIDIINAESESEIKAGYNLMKGTLHQEVDKIQNKVTEILSKIEVALDYPDEDLEEETSIDVKSEVNTLLDKLKKLANTYSSGRLIKQGTKIAIVGKTNVGKSSLLNGLINYDRAIVTNIEGTTRDVLEETFVYKGIKFILLDTAGIRNTQDTVEQIGIEKSKESIENADLVLFVIDGSQKLDKQDLDIWSMVSDKKCIIVLNKNDLGEQPLSFDTLDKSIISISAQQNHNLDKLKETIYNTVIDNKILESNVVITNQRHIVAINNAIESMEKVISAINQYISLDLVSIDLKSAWLYLGEITGVTENEEIINSIFTKFCVGK